MRRSLIVPVVLWSLLASCGDTETSSQAVNGGTSGTSGAGGSGGGCPTLDSRFPAGDPAGHADPYGAKAAGQARAGRITDKAQIHQASDARHRVRVGDFVLANDKIAAYVEDKGLSDGYARFGGEILALDLVDDSGKPRALSHYGESLLSLGSELIEPESVTVMNDGSDGKAAVIRANGKLSSMAFLGVLSSLLPEPLGLPAYQDFILEPGAEYITIRLGLKNPGPDPIDFTGLELHGFLHSYRTPFFTVETAFGAPNGKTAFLGFEDGEVGFAWRKPDGKQLAHGIDTGGVQYYVADGFNAPACADTTLDLVQVIVGGPYVDGLRETIRRVDKDGTWRKITGKLTDANATAVGDAWVHVIDADGKYLARTKTASDGTFTVHGPPGKAVKLVPTLRGYPAHEGVEVAPSESSTTIAFAPNGVIHVVATEQGSNEALPVRVQIYPTAGVASLPEEFGIEDAGDARLHQDFAVHGESTLVVPPGEHRVIISRGFEYEISQQTVTVTGGQTVEVTASLEHSVDTAGVMCGDFHIHSFYSTDATDPFIDKVKGTLAEGLEVPVSSEHEWIRDFQPAIEDLGATKWAYGLPSEELSTFTWGHFGVVPLEVNTEAQNNGAIDWVGGDPTQVFAQVRAIPTNPVLIVNHPNSTSFKGYFTAAHFDNATASGDADFWSDNFDAIEVFNESSLDENRTESLASWFGMLEKGYSIFAVGSSDSHTMRSVPVGYPRTCLRFGHDDPTLLSHAAVRDAIRAVPPYVSGGLVVDVTGPGGERPGATISGASGTLTFTIRSQAPSWLAVNEIEVFVNGESVSTTPATAVTSTTSALKYENTFDLTVDASRPRSWIAVHARGPSDSTPVRPGRQAFAMSNPIFVTP